MNYKETLYFVAQCLTLSLEPEKRLVIQQKSQAGSIDWEAVVKVSTAHLVFPALYCNLKRAHCLQYIPEELVFYMEHITRANRERNQQIIKQAQELKGLLLANKITPIFLKGTGNLLAGLYEDVAERMVGDIDFIFSKENYSKAIKILRDNGYSEVVKTDYNFPNFRHYQRLKKDSNIAAIEIHKELLIEKYASEFNFSFVQKDCQLIDGFAVLSHANKLNLCIIANQINDSGFYYKTMALRNAYDVLLLSKKTNAKDAVNKLDKLSHPLNCFLAACYEVFNKVDSLEYNETRKTASYLSVFNYQFANIRKTRIYHKRIKNYLFVRSRLFFFLKAIIYKDWRVWLFNRLTDKNWYREKLIQLGIKQSNY